MLDAAERLPSFERPALVVWASQDRVMPPEHGRRLAELLPHGRLVEITDSYTLIPLDQPTRLAEAIQQFTHETHSLNACAAGRRRLGGRRHRRQLGVFVPREQPVSAFGMRSRMWRRSVEDRAPAARPARACVPVDLQRLGLAPGAYSASINCARRRSRNGSRATAASSSAISSAWCPRARSASTRPSNAITRRSSMRSISTRARAVAIGHLQRPENPVVHALLGATLPRARPTAGRLE